VARDEDSDVCVDGAYLVQSGEHLAVRLSPVMCSCVRAKLGFSSIAQSLP
jgi:hypothetical protein